MYWNIISFHLPILLMSYTNRGNTTTNFYNVQNYSYMIYKSTNAAIAKSTIKNFLLAGVSTNCDCQ